ncbi:MAG: HAD family hydrolase [Prevotella sp.]|jgi:beta-phosphoglucomutase
MIKAALFDLDGVVFDTEPQYTKFWGNEFRRYYPETPGLEEKIKGQTLVQIFDEFFAGQQDVQKAVTERLNQFELEMDFPYIEGFQTFVRALRESGVLTAIVTSSNQQKMRAVRIKHPDFSKQFDAILTSEDFAKSKPDPDCYLKGAARLGVQVNECLGFEDSFNGLKAVRSAGMYCVGLSTTNEADAIRPLCDTVVPNFLNLQVANLIHQ